MQLGLTAGPGGVEGGESSGVHRWWWRERGVRGKAEIGRRGELDGRGLGVESKIKASLADLNT
jgi:hypothetical protein